MFDATIQPISFDIVAIPDEEQPHLLLQFLMGVKVPAPNGAIALLPTGAVKAPLGKEVAITKAKEMLEAAESLPDPKPDSGLIVAGASDLGAVQAEAEERAKVEREIREGDGPAAA